VNTPLAVISTYAQMLAKQISGDEQKAPLLEKNRPADFPRQRDRQFTAEFFPNVADRVLAVDLNKVIRETLTLVSTSYCRPVSKSSCCSMRSCRASRAMAASCSRCS